MSAVAVFETPGLSIVPEICSLASGGSHAQLTQPLPFHPRPMIPYNHDIIGKMLFHGEVNGGTEGLSNLLRPLLVNDTPGEQRRASSRSEHVWEVDSLEHRLKALTHMRGVQDFLELPRLPTIRASGLSSLRGTVPRTQRMF